VRIQVPLSNWIMVRSPLRELWSDGCEMATEESGSRYHKIFNTMDEMFQLLELIYDEGGKVIDYIYLDVNPAFERLTGRTKEQLVGHRVKDIFGVIEDHWLEVYDRAVKTGETQHFENYGAELDKYYEIRAWRASEGQCAVLFTDITERKKAEEAVLEERDRLSSLVNSISDEVWFADIHGKFTLTNPSAIREFGLVPNEKVDVEKLAASLEVLHPDGSPRPVNKAPASRALKGEMIRNEEEIIRTPATGEFRYRQVNASPVRGAKGDIIGSVAVVRDITERKKAEEALRESEAKYRGLFENLHEAVGIYKYVYDEDGKVVDWLYLDANQATEKELGKKKEELIGRTAFQVFGDSAIAQYKPMVRKMKETGTAILYDHYFEPVDRYYHNVFAPLSEETFMASALDITDINRAQRAIAESEKKYRSIGELIPFGIWTTDAQGQANYISSSFCELVGKSEEEILKFGWLGTLDPETVERTVSDWKKTIESGDFWNYTHRIMGQDGLWHYVLARGVPIKDEKGKVLGWGGVNIDITEQMKNEENLTRSNAELQQFAYVASHDLQEPLRMVISYLSLLDKKYKDKLDPNAQEYIHYAVDGGKRMRLLIDDLLAYSRIDTQGKEFAPVAMNEVVEDVIKVLKVSIEQSKANIVVEPLPIIVADGTQMAQVMQNLLSNAVKFRGKERPIVHISATQGPREWTFAIKDNGIGLNMEHIDKLFQMFQRLNTREQYPGTGVGLAIAKKIVERHGGRIWVESEEGKGATFYFSIPKAGGGEMNDES
jgi:PAS domain S-box-containing protein